MKTLMLFLIALFYIFIVVVMLASFVQQSHNPDECSRGFGLRQEAC